MAQRQQLDLFGGRGAGRPKPDPRPPADAPVAEPAAVDADAAHVETVQAPRGGDSAPASTGGPAITPDDAGRPDGPSQAARAITPDDAGQPDGPSQAAPAEAPASAPVPAFAPEPAPEPPSAQLPTPPPEHRYRPRSTESAAHHLTAVQLIEDPPPRRRKAPGTTVIEASRVMFLPGAEGGDSATGAGVVPAVGSGPDEPPAAWGSPADLDVVEDAAPAPPDRGTPPPWTRRMSDLVRRLQLLERGDKLQLQLTLPQAHALHALRDAGSLRMQELADALGLAQSTVTRLVAPLKRMGLLDRRPDELDGRATRAFLTPAGARAVEQLEQADQQLYGALLDRLPESRRASVVAAVELLHDAVREATGATRSG